MFDFLKIADKIKEAKAEMEAAQQALAAQTFDGEAGGGLVQVRVRGDRRLVSVQVDPQLLAASEQETMQDLVVAATNIAIEKAEAAAQAITKERASGLLGQFPGLDLSKLL